MVLFSAFTSTVVQQEPAFKSPKKEIVEKFENKENVPPKKNEKEDSKKMCISRKEMAKRRLFNDNSP